MNEPTTTALSDSPMLAARDACYRKLVADAVKDGGQAHLMLAATAVLFSLKPSSVARARVHEFADGWGLQNVAGAAAAAQALVAARTALEARRTYGRADVAGHAPRAVGSIYTAAVETLDLAAAEWLRPFVD